MLKPLVAAFGKRPVDEISNVEIRAWYASLDPTKRTARAHQYALLHNILNGAVDDELIEVNPCRIRAAGSTKRLRRIQPATLEQLANLVAEMPDRYRVLILAAAWCALRFGELTELRRHDVELASDDSGGWLHVRRAVTWPTPHTPVVSPPKSAAGVRDVAIPPRLVPLLRVRQGSLYKVFKRARMAIGRPDLRFHDLRHTGADRLGHSTPQAALIYQRGSSCLRWVGATRRVRVVY